MHSLGKQHRPAFTLIELMVVIGIIAVLLGILVPVLMRVRQQAVKIRCMNNLRQLVAADMMYLNENHRLPATSNFIPSSISAARLQQIADTLGMTVPAGPTSTWPRRPQQPEWFNCPFAIDSGFAEGMTLGGGLYTGYVYVGGIESSPIVTGGMGILAPGHHTAPLKAGKRGVMWADILTEYITSDPRRYEFFHRDARKAKGPTPDFRFRAQELEGIHRGWSDGSVEWVPGDAMDLGGPTSPDCQLQHVMGNYYY